MPACIRVVNWSRFQHYKNRNPPWIKLHRALLDNREWHALSGDASKVLAACWLIASEYDDGSIPLGTQDFTWRLRREDATHVAALLVELEAHGFVELVDHDASTMLAERKQPASDLLDRGEAEGETEITPSNEGAADAAAEYGEEIDADVEIVEPGPEEIRPSNVIALRPSDPAPHLGEHDPDEPVNGGQIMAAWIRWKRPPLGKHDRGRQAAAAQRIAEGRTWGQVQRAMIGMDCVWPYAPPSLVKNSESRAWDLMNLEKDFIRAYEGAALHPAIQRAREDAEWGAFDTASGWYP